MSGAGHHLVVLRRCASAFARRSGKSQQLERDLLPSRVKDWTKSAKYELEHSDNDVSKEPKKGSAAAQQAALPGVCFVCGSTGHWSRDCPSNDGSYVGARKRGVCYLCGKTGHSQKKCPDARDAAFPTAGVASTRVFVDNLSPQTSWGRLKDHFRDLGLEPTYTNVLMDTFTRKSQLRGIVEFGRAREAAEAIAKAHATELDGAKINARFDRSLKNRLEAKKEAANAKGPRNVVYKKSALPAQDDEDAPQHHSRRSRQDDYNDRFEGSDPVDMKGKYKPQKNKGVRLRDNEPARPWRKDHQRPVEKSDGPGDYDFDDDFKFTTDETTGEVVYPDDGDRDHRTDGYKKAAAKAEENPDDGDDFHEDKKYVSGRGPREFFSSKHKPKKTQRSRP